MDRKEWSALIARYGRDEAIKFFETHKNDLDFEVISGPEQGLTMVKMREHAQNSLFYIGEVLITETKIRRGQTVGIGLIKGEDETFSLALSFIDLVNKCSEFTEEFNMMIERLSAIEDENVKERTERILQTKVSFDMMND